jgi:hypothetical protein
VVLVGDEGGVRQCIIYIYIYIYIYIFFFKDY